MNQIGADLKANAHRIVEAWDQAAHGEPWLSLPKDYRIDHLPRVISGLAEASLCNPHDVDAHRSQLWAAAKHGAERRRHGFSEHMLFREYHLLRHIIWRYLQRQGYTKQVEAITRIDTAISLATTASLRGFYRSEFEERGEWPECLEVLVSESPFLPDRP